MIALMASSSCTWTICQYSAKMSSRIAIILNSFLSRLKDHELFVWSTKCDFLKEQIAFLGLIVGKNGLRAAPKKVDVLKICPKPSTLIDVRSFLGLIQFFRRFFREIFRNSNAINELSESPDWKKQFRGHIDASQLAVGGTLTQFYDEKRDRVIAYFSKKLSPTEKYYTANDRELLGLLHFLKRFRCYLEGASFEIFTDNQVLKHFFSEPKLRKRKRDGWKHLPTLVTFQLT